MNGSRLHLAIHVVIVLAIDAAGLMLLAVILPGFTLDGPAAALGTAISIGILNALVWPAVARLTVRISVMTLGLSALVLNAALVAIAIAAVPGAEMDGPLEAIVVTISITVLTAAISSLLAIDQEDAWYRNVVGRHIRRRDDWIESDVPGLLLLEIDGLAHEVLRRAMANGSAPTLARMQREGSHHLRAWETDWSSQTGACQAGILHGNNAEMPAFRWWEKERGGPIVTNHPGDAAELERRRSDGRGLLFADGASRANILSGDAPHSMLTMSTVLKWRGKLGRDYTAYFSRPYAVIRTATLALVDIVRERRAAARQARSGVWPRVERRWPYPLVRAWATVVQLDLQVSAVVADILAGRPAVYTTFLAYDEVAHHSGIERPDTLAVLRHVDHQIARIASACADAPRPYEIVVLSDHGQSQGATFLQRYGLSLEELVTEAGESAEEAVHTAKHLEGTDEAGAYLRAGLAESGMERNRAARRVAEASRRADGQPTGDRDAERRRRRRRREPEGGGVDSDTGPGGEQGVPEISVMASGCLGLISFPRIEGQASMEQIETLHPRLIDALRSHPGIGFVVVRSDRYGVLALGPDGVHELEHDRVEGSDPLLPFGPNARRHVLRTARFGNCPDILVNSTYWHETDEVAAFEELVGSHGGLGGGQCRPFVLHPERLAWPDDEVVGAESLHAVLRGWLVELGHEAYEEAVPSS